MSCGNALKKCLLIVIPRAESITQASISRGICPSVFSVFLSFLTDFFEKVNIFKRIRLTIMAGLNQTGK